MSCRHLCPAILLLVVVWPLVASANPCLQSLHDANISWPGADFNYGILNIASSALSLRGAILAGAAQWNNCPSTSEEFPAFPFLVESGYESGPSHVDITIEKINGLGPPSENGGGDTTCGSFSTVSRVMKIYTIKKDQFGDTWNCPLSEEAVVEDIVAHELGHFFGLKNVPESCGLVNIMAPLNVVQASQGTQPVYNAISKVTDDVCAFADGLSSPPAEGSAGGGGSQEEENNEDLDPPSPVLVSTLNGSYLLTSREEGVFFDLNADGEPELTAWTDATSDDAFLVFDLNGNGQIDDGTELFGNYTAQSPSEEPNGFLALAEWDLSSNGGDGDGRIDSNDDIFDYLRLWIDSNHNGLSEVDELFSLQSLGFQYIDLDYKESRRTDPYGNEFRFKSKVGKENGIVMAWDVFFVS